MLRGKGKGLVRRLFVPSCDWLRILAGRWPRTSCLGAGTNSVLTSYSNWKVAHSVLTGTLPNNKLVKALGSTLPLLLPQKI